MHFLLFEFGRRNTGCTRRIYASNQALTIGEIALLKCTFCIGLTPVPKTTKPLGEKEKTDVLATMQPQFLRQIFFGRLARA